MLYFAIHTSLWHRGASTSTYVQRVSAEQIAIESRLIELDGMETINTGLKNTRLNGEVDMSVDLPLETPSSRTLDAKRKALSMFVRGHQLYHPLHSCISDKMTTRHLRMGHLLPEDLPCKKQSTWNVKRFCKTKSDRSVLKRRSVVLAYQSKGKFCLERKEKHEFGHTCEKTFCAKHLSVIN